MSVRQYPFTGDEKKTLFYAIEHERDVLDAKLRHLVVHVGGDRILRGSHGTPMAIRAWCGSPNVKEYVHQCSIDKAQHFRFNIDSNLLDSDSKIRDPKVLKVVDRYCTICAMSGELRKELADYFKYGPTKSKS